MNPNSKKTAETDRKIQEIVIACQNKCGVIEMTASDAAKKLTELVLMVGKSCYELTMHEYTSQSGAGVDGESSERFLIYDKGIPLFANEYETHIKDLLNEDITIVVKNGYCGEDDTYANNLLKLLNGK